MVVCVEERETECSCDVGGEEEQDEPRAGLTAGFLDVFIGEDADQDTEGDDCAVGDLHEGCDEGGEAEAFDDYGAEVGDS